MIFAFKKIKKLERFPKSSTFSVGIFLYHFSQLPVLLSWWPLPWQIKKSSCCQRTPYFFYSLEQFFSYISSSSIHVIHNPLCFTFCLRVYLSPLSLYLHFCVVLLCLGIAVINYIFSRLKKKKKVYFLGKTQSKMKLYNIFSVLLIPETALSLQKCSGNLPFQFPALSCKVAS